MSEQRPRRRSSILSNTISRVSETPSTRQRQSRKDEAIRRKADIELRKTKAYRRNSESSKKSKYGAGTVYSLRPKPALTVSETFKIHEAARLMAARRADCVLVTDKHSRLKGIFTAKDLAYCIASEGIDTHVTSVSKIMTPDPLCVTYDTKASDALNTMVQRGFRHLPVCNEHGDIEGLIDITKCLQKSLDKMNQVYGSSRKLFDAIEGAERDWSNQAPQLSFLMETLKDQIGCPTLETIIDKSPLIEVSPRSSVKHAARVMRENHTTAVLVRENGVINGIFTSKDMVLRVIAAQIEPSSCSVVRVMTPHPDTVPISTTILDALKRMYNGNFLNLPITDEYQEVIGLVDVLTLTYATLEQINSMKGQGNEGADLVMSKFLGSALEIDDSSSFISESHGRNYSSGYSEVLTQGSISEIGGQSSSQISNRSFLFKFRSAGGKVYRLNSITDDFTVLRETIVTKVLEESPNSDPTSIPPLCYSDDEGDQVLLSNNEDLTGAIHLARQNGWRRLVLTLAEGRGLSKASPATPKRKLFPAHMKASSSKVGKTTEPPPKLENPLFRPDKIPKVPSAPKPFIPDNLVVPVAVGGGFLAALIVAVIVIKVTSR